MISLITEQKLTLFLTAMDLLDLSLSAASCVREPQRWPPLATEEDYLPMMIRDCKRFNVSSQLYDDFTWEMVWLGPWLVTRIFPPEPLFVDLSERYHGLRSWSAQRGTKMHQRDQLQDRNSSYPPSQTCHADHTRSHEQYNSSKSTISDHPLNHLQPNLPNCHHCS